MHLSSYIYPTMRSVDHLAWRPQRWTALAVACVLATICVLAPAQNQQSTPFVGTDEQGNIFITTSGTNMSVFVDGVDLKATLVSQDALLWKQQQTIEELKRHRLVKPKMYLVGGWDGAASKDVQRLASGFATSWISSASMKQKRGSPGVVTFQGMLCAVGGWDGSRRLASAECFDGDGWSSIPSMSMARRYFATCWYKGRLYAIGGEGNAGQLGVVEAFDGKGWSTLEQLMPTPRQGLEAVHFRGLVYVVGGQDSDDASLAAVEVFDGRNWTAAPSMNTKRAYFGLTVFEGLLYAIGGTDGSRPESSMEVFDGVRWITHGARLHTARNSFGCAVFNNNIFAIGGRDGNNRLSSTEVFDGATWSPGLSMSPSRHGFRAVVHPPEFEQN